MTFLDKTGATILADEVKTYVSNTAVVKETGKGLSTNDYTTTEKNKLAGIATGAEVNQNAFSKVVVGSTTVAADSKTDTLTLAAGSNVTLTPDVTNDKITIASTNTWRGIQDNLTSTSTTDSLSANQGKVLKGLIDEVKSLRATLDAYGLTKVTDSSAVTDSTGLALPATEKNASISGTLANQISQLNTDKADINSPTFNSVNLHYGTKLYFGYGGKQGYYFINKGDGVLSVCNHDGLVIATIDWDGNMKLRGTVTQNGLT